MVVLMVGLQLKLQMETVDENDPAFSRLPSLHISILVLRTVMYPSAKTHPDICKDTSWHLQRHILTSAKTHPDICKDTWGPSQATKINLFAKIIQVLLLTIFLKSITVDVWRALITHLTYSKACNYLFHDGGPYHIETRANQWTCFYMIGTSAMKKLNVSQSMSR